MRLSITCTVILATALLAGCRSYPKAAPVEVRVEAVSPENASAIRAAYAEHFPGSQVGVVAAALPTDRLVAVGGVDLAQMAEGQIVTFIDARQNPLTTGKVVRVLPDCFHVLFDPPPGGGREPRVGDMMVRLKPEL
jgi:hypothetical protein